MTKLKKEAERAASQPPTTGSGGVRCGRGPLHRLADGSSHSVSAPPRERGEWTSRRALAAPAHTQVAVLCVVTSPHTGGRRRAVRRWTVRYGGAGWWWSRLATYTSRLSRSSSSCHVPCAGARGRRRGARARATPAGRTTTSALQLCVRGRRMVSFVRRHPAAAERASSTSWGLWGWVGNLGLGWVGLGLGGTKHAAKCPRAINFNANTVTTHTLVIVIERSYIF